MNIVFTYSAWWLLPGVILAAGLSMFLYYNDNKLADLRRWLKISLIGLRFLFVLSLVVLLLGPEVFFKRIEKKQPVFVILQDNSSSVKMNSDSVFYQEEYLGKLDELKASLAEKFEVRTILFGDSIRESDKIKFTDQISDMSDLANAVEIRFGEDEMAGVLFATDGLYNKGINPLNFLSKLPVPVYALALGDTVQQCDALISDVSYNKLAFLNNRFPLRVYYDAWDAVGNNLTVQIEHEGDVLFSENISVKDNPEQAFVDFNIEAKEIGLQVYKVRLLPLEGESILANNETSVIVNVIDNQQKILVIARAPHPDIAAMRRALETNLNFSVELYMASQALPKLNDYDLVILHDLPSMDFPVSNVFLDSDKLHVPLWFVFGSNMSFQAFNQLGLPVVVDLKGKTYDNAQPVFVDDFERFELPSGLIEVLDRIPPLRVPFANIRFTGEHELLFSQMINGVKTNKCLFAFTENENYKNAFLIGSGLWQWRMSDFKINGNHKAFDELINKTVQFLIMKQSSKQFSVRVEQLFTNNENIHFEAELYDEAWELNNLADVSISIVDSMGNEISYPFNRSAKSYRLNIGSLPAGKYIWRAETKWQSLNLMDEGVFVVRDLALEGLKTRANHQLLSMIASRSGGDVYYPSQMDDVSEDLINSDLSKTRLLEKQDQTDLINMKWIFILLLSWVSLEWFLRKYFGTY